MAAENSSAPSLPLLGWDVGGAHLKACRMQGGRVVDVAQWPCPLWQGLAQLDAALQQAQQRWPDLPFARHAVTMTGEMVDCFADREDGVNRIARHLQQNLSGPVAFYAGERGWCDGADVAAQWDHIASANWLATARHVALWAQAQPVSHAQQGLLVDIGSTTTDIIAFAGGQVRSASRSDAERLISGELVYQGVVRTPLCALGPRITLQGRVRNVMNEFFATTADVYRLTGELLAAHDQHPAADGAAKDAAASRQRLARMVGLDARDATAAEWGQFARAWRAAQVAEIGGQLRRVWQASALPTTAAAVAAGCGAFLLPDVLAAAGVASSARLFDYGLDVMHGTAGAAPEVLSWAAVCAPSVAVAALLAMEPR